MREKIKIREMSAADIDAVLAVENLSFSHPWSRQAFESEMSGMNPCVYFVALKDDIICGYMGIWYILDEGHITNVAVHPECRGEGIGRMLVDKTVSDGISKGIKAFTLEVRVSNHVAQKLYKNCGFVSSGVRKGYYENNEDALIMWKYIGEFDQSISQC